MFRFIKTTTILLFWIIGIFALQVLITYFFSIPFNQINVVLLFLTWLIPYKKSYNMLWLALFLSLITELFSSHPFGLITSSNLLSLIFVRYIFSFLFTNFSWYSMLLLGFLTILLQKVIMFCLIYFFTIFNKIHFNLQRPDLISVTLECLVNAFALLTVYLISSLFIKKRRYDHAF